MWLHGLHCRKMSSAVNFATARIHRPPHCILIRLIYDSADVRSIYYGTTVRLREPP